MLGGSRYSRTVGWKAIWVAHSAGRSFASYGHHRMLQILWTHFSIKSILWVTPFVRFLPSQMLSWSEGQGTKNIPSISIIFNFQSLFFHLLFFNYFRLGVAWLGLAVISYPWIRINTRARRECLDKAGGVITPDLPSIDQNMFPNIFSFYFIYFNLLRSHDDYVRFPFFFLFLINLSIIFEFY